MIEQNANLKGKIKLLGVGMKDDIHYVNYFRKQFNVPFPLIPDKELAFHQVIGKPEVPFFIGLKLKEGGKKEIFYTRLGPVEGSAAEFLQMIIKKSGLK